MDREQLIKAFEKILRTTHTSSVYPESYEEQLAKALVDNIGIDEEKIQKAIIKWRDTYARDNIGLAKTISTSDILKVRDNNGHK